MNKSDTKHKVIFFIVMIAFVIAFFILKIYIEYECEEFSMGLQVIYTIMTMLVQSFFIFIFLICIVAILNFILIILALTILKRCEVITEKLASVLDWIIDAKHLIVIVLLFSCFIPFADTAAYKVADKRVIPIMVVARQFMDVFEEPMIVTISDCGKGVYTQVLLSKRGRSSSIDGNYLLFTADEKEYVTPVTNNIRKLMTWVEFENMEYRVKMYPNSGMVVEFVDQPHSRYADNQDMLDRLTSSKGEPYGIVVTEDGLIKITENVRYIEEDYIKYGLKMEKLVHLYLGEQEYQDREMGMCFNLDMNEEGLHKFVVINEKSLKLSKTLVVYIEDGQVDYYDYDSYDKIYIN